MATGRRPAELSLVPYEEFRATLAETGLIGLVHDPYVNAIQMATDSDYCHSLVIGWCVPIVGQNTFTPGPSSLVLAESTGPIAQISSLRWRIRQKSGLIDFFRLRPELQERVDIGKVWWQMQHFSGQDYPEKWITRDLLAIATGQVVLPIENSDEQESPRHCSGALHWAFRTSGLPPLCDYDYLVFPASGKPKFKGWADPTITEYVGTPVFSQ